MSQVTETICDQCGARKDKANHWWSVEITPNYFRVFREWVDPEPAKKDVCSEGCLTRALDDFIQGKTNGQI